jgi:phage-related protein
MSSVTSSTSTIVSPYASVTEQVKPGKYEANAREYGSVGAAVLGVGDAIAQGASATVSLSEKALGAVEDAGSYLGKAVETGFTDIGSAAMAAYAAVRKGINSGVEGVENATEATWDTLKAGAEDVAGMAGDVVHAAEAGAEAVADVAVDAWHGVEHLASEVLHGIEKGTDELEHLGSEAWTAVQNGTHRARDYAGELGDGIKTAAGYVGDGIGEVADGVGNVAGRVASYATVGAAAVERAFSAVV